MRQPGRSNEMEPRRPASGRQAQSNQWQHLLHPAPPVPCIMHPASCIRLLAATSSIYPHAIARHTAMNRIETARRNAPTKGAFASGALQLRHTSSRKTAKNFLTPTGIETSKTKPDKKCPPPKDNTKQHRPRQAGVRLRPAAPLSGIRELQPRVTTPRTHKGNDFAARHVKPGHPLRPSRCGT